MAPSVEHHRFIWIEILILVSGLTQYSLEDILLDHDIRRLLLHPKQPLTELMPLNLLLQFHLQIAVSQLRLLLHHLLRTSFGGLLYVGSPLLLLRYLLLRVQDGGHVDGVGVVVVDHHTLY